MFITGSGTDVGKTYVTAALIESLISRDISVRAIKPIISGFDEEDLPASDTGILLNACGIDPTPEAIETMSPWRFPEPLSPDMAASRENKSINLSDIVAFCDEAASGPEDMLLIEGVGGVMVPLNNTDTVLDWMEASALPALLVVGSYLGTLSHTLTALHALNNRRIDVSAIVICESEKAPVSLQETADTLRNFVPETEIICVGRDDPSELTKLGDTLFA